MYSILIAVILVCGLIFIANLYQAERFNNIAVINVGLLVMIAINVAMGGLVILATMPLNSSDVTIQVPMQSGIAFFTLSLLFAVISIGIVFSGRIRNFLQRYIIRSNGKDRRYRANSIVHTTALILMIFVSLITVGNFVLAGGVEGLAESIAETGFGIQDLLVNFIMYTLTALLGVGIFIRRNFVQAFSRLGIALPNSGRVIQWAIQLTKQLVIGAIVGFGLFWIQVSLSLIWQLSVSPETLAEQTAATQAIFAAFSGSLWLGFVLALTAGIGEELLFRGALQPIFGNLLVSIFFVFLHTQYALTPASLIILLVSLVFGFLRTRYATPAAMVAHFVYNFTPFALLEIVAQLGIPLEALTILGIA